MIVRSGIEKPNINKRGSKEPKEGKKSENKRLHVHFGSWVNLFLLRIFNLVFSLFWIT